jgi:hypothetical protein
VALEITSFLCLLPRTSWHTEGEWRQNYNIRAVSPSKKGRGEKFLEGRIYGAPGTEGRRSANAVSRDYRPPWGTAGKEGQSAAQSATETSGPEMHVALLFLESTEATAVHVFGGYWTVASLSCCTPQNQMISGQINSRVVGWSVGTARKCKPMLLERFTSCYACSLHISLPDSGSKRAC